MTNRPELPKTLTQADFDLIAGLCFRQLKRRIALGLSLRPIVSFGVINDGEVIIKQTVMPTIADDEDKEMIVMMMEAALCNSAIDFAVGIFECWYVRNPEPMGPEDTLADHPRKIEAVIVNILSKDSQVVVIHPLHRNPTRIEPGESFTEMKGRFVRPKPPRH